MYISVTQFSLLILLVALCAPAVYFIVKRREANLIRLNDELRQARQTLEKSNRDLARIDTAKSDFISIASHDSHQRVHRNAAGRPLSRPEYPHCDERHP